MSIQSRTSNLKKASSNPFDVSLRMRLTHRRVLSRRLRRVREIFRNRPVDSAILNSIRKHQRQLTAGEIHWIAWGPLVLLAVFIIEVLIFCQLTEQTARMIFPHYQLGSAFVPCLLTSVISFIVFALCVQWVGRWIIRALVPWGGFVSVGALVAVTYQFWTRGQISGSEFGAIVGVVGSPVILLGIRVAALVGWRIDNAIISRRYPDSLFVTHILSACWVTNVDNRWQNLQRKRELILSLESAASVIETSFPKQLRMLDMRSDAWVRSHVQRKAAALREFKKWVYSPRRQTRNEINDRMRHILLSAAQGEWGDLPEREVERVTYGQVRANAAHFFAALIRAGIPLLSLFILQWARPLPQLLFDKALTTTIGICFAYLLISLDSNAESQFRSASNVLGVFTKPSGG